jgi:hypothetical protein
VKTSLERQVVNLRWTTRSSRKRVDYARWGVVVVEGIGVFQQHLSVDLTKKYSAVCISSQKPAPTSLRKSPGDEHFDQIIEET